VGQARIRQRTTKTHVIKHAFHERHGAPRGDFFVRKPKVKVHKAPCTEIAMHHFTHKSGNSSIKSSTWANGIH
jgi:hypothetical protein